jgi:hypothetical protein
MLKQLLIMICMFDLFKNLIKILVAGIKYFRQLLNVFGARHSEMNATKGFWIALSSVGFHTAFR